MSLLAEYALTPDVFDSSSYSSAEVCDMHLEDLKEVLLSDAIVRDLRLGEWANLFASSDRHWHLRAKEILKKLKKQNRLHPSQPALPTAPQSDKEWCEEAIKSHEMNPFDGIIATANIADAFTDQEIVGSINERWWRERKQSVRLTKTLADYQFRLHLILKYANSMMFIDHYIDPTQHNYRAFPELIKTIGGRSPSPLIEIHRVCYEGSGKNRKILAKEVWEERFHTALEDILKDAGLAITVFLWDDFHDRYLISDIVGISVPYGFDTDRTSRPTTWSRLGRADRDDVQREFDQSANRHGLIGTFVVGI